MTDTATLNRSSQSGRSEEHLIPLRIASYLFACIPFFLFSGVEDVIGETLREAWQISGLLLMAVFLLRQDRILVDCGTICFVLYELLVLTVTTLGTEFRPGIAITILCYLLITFLILNDRANMLHALCILLGLALLLNTFSMIRIGTGGFHKSYFIGGKNSLSIVLVPGIFLVYLLYLEYAETTRSVLFHRLFLLFFVVSVASMIYGQSGTGVVMGIVAFCTIILARRFTVRKRSMFIVLGVLYLLILSGNQFFQSSFWLDFTEFLGKDPTLTYRTFVWESALEIFRNEPFFGHGRIFTISYLDEFGLRYSVREAHNFILQILCDGGIVGLFLYGIYLTGLFRRLSLNDSRQRTVFTALILLLVNGLTEAVNYHILTIILPALAMSYLSENAGKDGKDDSH